MSTPADRIGLVTFDVEHEPAYAAGFPVNVAITVHLVDKETWISRLPLPSTLRTYGAVGLKLFTSGTTTIIHETRPSATIDPHTRIPSFRLAPNESRRLLVDISEVFPAQLAVTAYSAQLSYGDAMMSWPSNEFQLTLRPRAAVEQAELDAILPDVQRKGDWGQWTMFAPDDPKKPIDLPTSKADPLRYNKIIRYFLYGPQDLKHIPLTCLDVLDGLFAPEAAALKAELLAARDMGAFRNQAFHVRQKYPGLSYWMAEIEARQSTFAWARGNR